MIETKKFPDVWYESITDLLKPPSGLRLPWWPKITESMGGLRPHELTLLCAPTGTGKTQILANLVAQLLFQNIPMFVAPVETGRVDFIKRIISTLENKDYNDGSQITVSEAKRISDKFEPFMKDKELYIATCEERVDVEEMIETLTFMHAVHKVKVAILDNLNFFLKVTSTTMEKAEMDEAIHRFVVLCKQIPMHVILVVHPRKTINSRVESEFDIKGSSTAVQEAANVILFNRPTPEQIKDFGIRPTDRELIFKKIRKRGSNVNKPIFLAFENLCRYQEYEWSPK